MVLLLSARARASDQESLPAPDSVSRQDTEGPDLSFIENKGQWEPQVKFKSAIPGGSVFITDQGFVYNFSSQEDLAQIHEQMHSNERNDTALKTKLIRSHAYYVNFIGANKDISYSREGKRPYYHNYFIGNDPAKWAGGVLLFEKITQKGIYKGIDMVTYSDNAVLKYDFIVSAGCDPGQIRLSFEGVAPRLDNAGNLVITTSVNEVVEQAPYAFQEIGGKEISVKCIYKLREGILNFAFPEGYNAHYPLIIDPEIVFSTYSGSSYTAYSGATTYDSSGNLYAGSFVYGQGWPTTAGAAQSTFFGATDVGINKYNAAGTALIYATYYGGYLIEYPHAMMVNAHDELIVAGHTLSTTLPIPPGSFDTTLTGGEDLFVVRFNAAGTAILGATYLGGSGIEGRPLHHTTNTTLTNFAQNATSPVELNIDEDLNIWIVSNTKSTDFPLTQNAYQNVIGGDFDGVICKLNPTCTQLLYSTFYGGNGTDAIYGIQFTASGNLAICGSTESSNFPTTAGVLNPGPQGAGDGFISIINSVTGAMEISTYVGTDMMDHAVNIQVDETDNVYVLGRTTGNYPISPGVYYMPGADCFIDKLDSLLSTSLLSTRIGGNPIGVGDRFFPVAFLLDMCGQVYVTGLSDISGSTIPGLPTTPNAYASDTRSFWFIVLRKNFEGPDPLYASYFGSINNYLDHTHAGVHRLDPQGIVYHSLCAVAPTGSFPITPNAVFPVKITPAGQQDILSFKFNFEAAGVQALIALDTLTASNDTGCAPYTIQFENASTSLYPMEFNWDFGDGSPTSAQVHPAHTFADEGVYEVVLHAHSELACFKDSWDTLRVLIFETEVPDIVTRDTLICSPEAEISLSVTINNPTPNNQIIWGPPVGILSANDQPVITIDPALNEIYYVTVKDTIPGICGFSLTDTVLVDFAPRLLNILTEDTVVCEGSQLQVSAVSNPDYTTAWSPATGMNDTTILDPVITVNQPEVYTLTASYPGCPDTSQLLMVGMHYLPHVDLGPDIEVCQWQPVALQSHVTPFRNDYTYEWSPAAALANATGPDAQFTADTSGSYTLEVKTPVGCRAFNSVYVTVFPGGFGEISADTAYCLPNEVPLLASGGVRYTWDPVYGLDDSTSPSPVASPETSTAYTVYIFDEHGCVDTERVSIDVYPSAVITLPDSITVYPGEAYHLEPGTNCLYFNWFPTSGLNSTVIADPTFSPVVRTRYFVTGRTEHDCVTRDSIDVLVSQTVLGMPNAFTPGHGLNNVFKVSKRGTASLKEFSVFNRWGNKVFSTSDIDEGWDGTFNGSPQPIGVYIYIIDAVTETGERFRQRGNVTLLR